MTNYFTSGCTILYSHQQYLRIPVLLADFFTIVVLVVVKWYVVVPLIYTSLMTNDVEHLFSIDHASWPFVYLLWRNVHLSALPISKLFPFCCWKSFLCFLDINPNIGLSNPSIGYQSRYLICKYFLLFCGLFFTLMIEALWCTKFFHFDKAQLIYLFLLLPVPLMLYKKSLPNSVS